MLYSKALCEYYKLDLYIYIYIFFYRTNVYWIAITGARALPLLLPPLPRAGRGNQSIMVDRST